MRVVEIALAAGAALLPLRMASAVVVYVPGTPNPTATRNTTVPPAPLADGWNLQGDWGAFLGTPIAPNYFITAGHVGGSVGGTFAFNAVNYTTIAFFDDPASDLRIWQVSGTFPTYAPLYNAVVDGSEVGKHLVVIGRGLPAGAEVNGLATPSGTELKGWREAATGNGPRSWGENDVAGIASAGAGVGQLLAFTFDRAVGEVAGSNESHLNGFDSGGGVFIQSGGVWKLAGINFGVDGRYKEQLTDTPFRAMLFDRGGVYQEGPTNVFTLNIDTLADQPGASYATRISANLAFIGSAIPEPSSALLIAAACSVCAIRRRARRY